jgi:hypothetical protein
MIITLFIILISAFYTAFILSSVYFLFSYLYFLWRLICGIGGFLAGLVIPHDNGYTISIVEKLEGKGKGKITVAVPFRNRRVPYYIHEHVGKNMYAMATSRGISFCQG